MINPGWFWSGNFKNALASLRASKWRSFLTMMGVVIGIASVITVVSLGEGLKRQVTGHIDQLGNDVLTIRPGKVVTRGSSGQIQNVNLLAFLNNSSLSHKDVASLRKLPAVQNVAPVTFVSSSASGSRGSSDNVLVVGTTPDLGQLLNLRFDHGSFFNESSAQSSAVLGANLGRELFQTRNPLARTATISGGKFIVRGQLAPSSGGLLSVGQTDFNSTIFIPYEAALKLTDNRASILQILVKAKPGQLDTAAAQIAGALKQNHRGSEDFTILKQYELLQVSERVVDSLTGFIAMIAAISLLVGGIGIMDIMLVAVTERTREIGVRKAIGATNRQILNQFLTEGLVLSLAGGVVGVVIAILINLGLKLYTGIEPVITISTVLLAVGVSIAVGIVFSGAPALKAATKQPIDALRGE